MHGTIGILNVGAGDTKLSFDPNNPEECARAARIITDMLKRGFSILVEDPPGSKAYRRAKSFDEKTHEYIIADMPAASEIADEPAAETSAGASAAKSAKPRRARWHDKSPGRRVHASSTHAISVGRTAGG